MKSHLVHGVNLALVQAVNQEGLGVQPGLASGLLYRRRGLNDRLLRAERAFLDSNGIPGASWYKHLVLFFTSILIKVVRNLPYIAGLIRFPPYHLLVSAVRILELVTAVFIWIIHVYVKLCISFII